MYESARILLPPTRWYLFGPPGTVLQLPEKLNLSFYMGFNSILYVIYIFIYVLMAFYIMQLPEKLNLSFLHADVYISSYIFLHFYICLCVFAYFLSVFYVFLDFFHVKLID